MAISEKKSLVGGLIGCRLGINGFLYWGINDFTAARSPAAKPSNIATRKPDHQNHTRTPRNSFSQVKHMGSKNCKPTNLTLSNIQETAIFDPVAEKQSLHKALGGENLTNSCKLSWALSFELVWLEWSIISMFHISFWAWKNMKRTFISIGLLTRSTIEYGKFFLGATCGASVTFYFDLSSSYRLACFCFGAVVSHHCFVYFYKCSVQRMLETTLWYYANHYICLISFDRTPNLSAHLEQSNH